MKIFRRYFTCFFLISFINPAFSINLDGSKDTVDVINKRYQQTDSICPESGKSGYYCNGVMIRALSGEVDPWEYSDSSVKRKAVSFSYIRKDIKTKRLHGFSGIIFFPSDSMPDGFQSYQNYCQFPSNAATIARDPETHGCGDVKPPIKDTYALSEKRDFSTCSSKGVFTADDFIDKYLHEESGLADLEFCSFSTVEDTMNIVIEIQNRLSNLIDYGVKYNESVISSWNRSHPESVPIEAFWYDKDHVGSIIDAILYRDRYKDATGIERPILEYDGKNPLNPFSLPLPDDIEAANTFLKRSKLNRSRDEF